jgi:secondary thiamine-phosphate synthase enzyme
MDMLFSIYTLAKLQVKLQLLFYTCSNYLYFMKEISLSTSKRYEIIDITNKVEKAITDSKVKEGICVVYAPHSTAAILVMETDAAVEKDVLHSLSNLVPKEADYNHNHGPQGHGAAHVESALFGPSKAIPIENGKLQLGTWQSITFCELDGPRSDRKVLIQVVNQ